MSQLPNVDPSEPKRPSQPPDKCAQCGAPEASSIHATESKNAEIRMASHRFAALPVDVEAARAWAQRKYNLVPGTNIWMPQPQYFRDLAAYASEQCTALRRELADVKGERDRQYEG